MEGVYCPYCHKKNETVVTRCIHCGERLIPVSMNGSMIDQSNAERTDCQKFLPLLSEKSIALVVDGTDHQLVIPQTRKIVLGRINDDDQTELCDLSSLGKLVTGVSRRHAVIRQTGDGFSIEDLNSTNGTSINGKRLEPGKAYALHCQDTIKLASLRLTICFHTAVKTERTEIRLRKRNKLALETRKLYPNFMSVHLVPYLEAVAELQRLVGLSRTRPPSEPRIHKIVEDSATILISLDLDASTRRIITHTLLPWRETHTEYIGWSNAINDAAMGAQLIELTNIVLQEVAPQETIMDKTMQKLQTAVATIITSPLDPVFTQEKG